MQQADAVGDKRADLEVVKKRQKLWLAAFFRI
jgi:hypothetical protein